MKMLCNQCNKEIENGEAYFSDRERDLDFCSENCRLEWKNWEDIHEDFGKKPYLSNKTYQQEWEKFGLTYQDVQMLISVGFKPYDYGRVKNWKNHNFTPKQIKLWLENLNSHELNSDNFFCVWLRDVKKLTPQEINTNNRDKLREEYNALWKNIHEGFGEKRYKKRQLYNNHGKTNQQHWERYNLNYQDAQEWIPIGFKPQDYYLVKKWKDQNFTYQEAEEFNKTLSDEIKYPDYKKKIHSGASYHSKLLPTKEITKLLQNSLEISEQLWSSEYSQSQTTSKSNNSLTTADYSQSQMIDVDFDQLNLNDNQQSENQTLANWQNLPNFTPQLTQSWINHNFTYSQTQDWINIGLNPNDYNFAHFLKNQKNLTSEQILNEHNIENLKQEFIQSQQNAQTLQPTN